MLNSFPATIEGMVGVAPDVNAQSVQAFSDAFVKRWKGATPTTGAFFYYDALALFAIAFERAAQDSLNIKPSAATLRDRILRASGVSGLVVDWNQLQKGITEASKGTSVDYSGVTGVISLDNTGSRSSAYTRYWTIRGNQLGSL